MKIGGHEINIANRDKVFFPDAGLTKGDLIDYYSKVAKPLIRHAKHYGVSLQRYPDGLSGDGFYQKDAPDYFPGWIRTIPVEKKEGSFFSAPVIDRVATLIYLADQAMVTPHLYLARIDDLKRPDRMIFDIDPPYQDKEAGVARQAALELRDVLTELDLPAWVQTTGSSGFHVIVPLRRGADFAEVRRFARDVARLLVRRFPKRYTCAQQKDRRQGRTYLDTFRNAYGATAVAPYAVRALPSAPVATPIDWDEVESGASPRDWTITNLPRRLAQKDDPFAGLLRHGRLLAGRRGLLDSLLAGEPLADEEMA